MQVRVSFGGIIGLDFPTFMQFGQLKGLDPAFLADLLPPSETLILRLYRKDTDGDPT